MKTLIGSDSLSRIVRSTAYCARITYFCTSIG